MVAGQLLDHRDHRAGCHRLCASAWHARSARAASFPYPGDSARWRYRHRAGDAGLPARRKLVLPGKAWWHPVPGALCAAVLPVALAGWWDDHRSLPILPRLGAQVLGAGLFSLSLLATGTHWWWLPLLIAGGVWSIN